MLRRAHCFNSRFHLQQRRAAILICVLVVLLIVGLLTTQTLQTLMLLRRGDTQRQQLRQARELIELGKMVAQQQSEELPENALVVPLSTIDSIDGQKSENTELAGISFSRIDDDQASPILRVTVNYPLDQPNEITATELVALEEQIP